MSGESKKRHSLLLLILRGYSCILHANVVVLILYTFVVIILSGDPQACKYIMSESCHVYKPHGFIYSTHFGTQFQTFWHCLHNRLVFENLSTVFLTFRNIAKLGLTIGVAIGFGALLGYPTLRILKVLLFAK